MEILDHLEERFTSPMPLSRQNEDVGRVKVLLILSARIFCLRWFFLSITFPSTFLSIKRQKYVLNVEITIRRVWLSHGCTPMPAKSSKRMQLSFCVHFKPKYSKSCTICNCFHAKLYLLNGSFCDFQELYVTETMETLSKDRDTINWNKVLKQLHERFLLWPQFVYVYVAKQGHIQLLELLKNGKWWVFFSLSIFEFFSYYL